MNDIVQVFAEANLTQTQNMCSYCVATQQNPIDVAVNFNANGGITCLHFKFNTNVFTGSLDVIDPADEEQ